jgi:hypothetical protein
MEGWLAGCGAATGVICGLVLVIVAIAPGHNFSVSAIVVLLVACIIVFAITCVLTGPPAAGIIWLSKKFQIRSIWYFGSAGAVIGIASYAFLFVAFRSSSPEIRVDASAGLFFALAGLAAGLTYWLVAGKYMGRGQSDDRT